MSEPPPLRVLVVDDDPAMLRLVRRCLAGEGLAVEVAAGGDEAIVSLERERFDAVILDLQMPHTDGRAVFRNMRSGGDRTPVLILSAYGAEAARGELQAEAAMSKPFDVDELVGAVLALTRASRPPPPRK